MIKFTNWRSFLLHIFLPLFCKQLLCTVSVTCFSHYAQGEVSLCQNVQPPVQPLDAENCSLVCSLKFEQAVSSSSSDDMTLCVKNTSLAVFCMSHNDCRQYHIGAYCKVIPCLCRAKSAHPEAYIFDSFYGVHKINTCVVSSKYVNADQPIVPFPWKTLLVVCAIVFVFAAILICLRWVSPLIRSMHAKRNTRNNRERQTAAPEDNASLCPQSTQTSDASPFTYYFPQGMPRIYRASPRRSQRNHRASTRAHYTSCAQADGTMTRTLTLSNEDKPPPYETAIQLPPPAYEDVERAIIESRRSATHPRTVSNQRVEIHATVETIAPTQPPPSASSGC